MGGPSIMVVAIVLIVFGSIFGTAFIPLIGKMLNERRQFRLEELKLKAQIDSQILGGSSAVNENMTAELQALREEVRQLKNEVNQLSGRLDSNYIQR